MLDNVGWVGAYKKALWLFSKNMEENRKRGGGIFFVVHSDLVSSHART